MKRSFIALAVLGAVSIVVHAEEAVSPLVIYGVADIGLTHETRVHEENTYVIREGQNEREVSSSSTGSKVTLGSGILQGSRIGFKGTEDLGNGLRAMFQLENGNIMNRGRQRDSSKSESRGFGAFFDRKAIVGFESDHWGRLTLGRQTDMLDTASEFTSIRDFGGVTGTPFQHTRLQGARVDNSIRYDTLNYGGFKLSTIYGFGGTPGSAKAGSAWGVGGMYANGPWGAYVGWFQSAYGKNPANGDGDDALNASVADNWSPDLEGRTASQILSMGLSTQLSALRLYGNWSRYKAKEYNDIKDLAGKIFPVPAVTKDVFELGLDWALNEQLHFPFAVQYVTNKSESDKKGKLWQINAGLDYWLSQRTDIYLLGAYQRIDENYFLESGIFEARDRGSNKEKTSNFGITFGIRHKF